MSGDNETLSRGTERWVEALTWHETLTEADVSHLTSPIIREWQAWYADPDNRRVFEHLTRLAADSRAVHPHLDPSRNEDLAAGESAAPVRWLSAGKRRPWLAAGVTAAMAAIAAFMVASPWTRIGARPGGGSIVYQTDVGGLKDAQLADGSEITLGGRTKLVVTFSPAARSVDLIRGEAWFRVAHDSRWPFVVHAGEGAIRDVGTTFLVTRDSDRVVVTVTEGTVAVTAPPLVSLSRALSRDAASVPPPPPIRLTRGEQLSFRDNGVVAPIARTNSDAATAWMRGRLIFDDEPLGYVIESVNRYWQRHIVATPSAARLRFSGVILNDEIEEWLRGLPAIIPVDVNENGADICIRMRAAQADAQCAVSDR